MKNPLKTKLRLRFVLFAMLGLFILLDSHGNQIGQTYLGAKSIDQWCHIIDALLENIKG